MSLFWLWVANMRFLNPPYTPAAIQPARVETACLISTGPTGLCRTTEPR